MSTIVPVSLTTLTLMAQAIQVETSRMKMLGYRQVAENLAEMRGECIFEILRILHEDRNGDLAVKVAATIENYVVDYGVFSRDSE